MAGNLGYREHPNLRSDSKFHLGSPDCSLVCVITKNAFQSEWTEIVRQAMLGAEDMALEPEAPPSQIHLIAAFIRHQEVCKGGWGWALEDEHKLVPH